MPVNSAAVGRVVAHGAADAQAQAEARSKLGGAPSGAAGAPGPGGSQGTASSAAPGSASTGAQGGQAGGEPGAAKAALAKVGAVFGAMTSAEQSLSTLVSGIPMPAFPAARINDWAFGPPHAHSHPPNLIPPAPPVPLPATGPIIKIPFVSGADKVLINNMPAARCGDIGVQIWCGGYFPFYEIFLGSSSVWIEGARAARLGVDITKHCIFSTPKPSDPPLGPMIGAIIQGSPNVIIGGVPLPSLTSFAVGKAFKTAFAGVGKAVAKVKAAKAAAQKAAQQAEAKAVAHAQAVAKKAVGLPALQKANPGAVFKSQDDAAKAAMQAVYPDSIAQNCEFGGLIYRDAHGNYGYTGPVGGTGSSVKISQGPVPSGTTEIGYYHSHGDYSLMDPKTGQPIRTSNPKKDDFNSDNFSSTDKKVAKARSNGDPAYQAYVVTPGGDMKAYDWQTNKVSDL